MGNQVEGAPDSGAIGDIDDTDLLEILSVETRIKILEAVAVIVFVAGWAVAAWTAFDDGESFGMDSRTPPQVRLYQMLSLGVGVTSATALIALAAIFYRGYAAWRRDKTGH